MFRPCIDLHNGKVKQIVGGSLKNNRAVENFVSDKDAAYYSRLFKQDGLSGGHVIMLGPGNEEEALKAIKAYPGGFQVGGGITPENAGRYLENGATHVIVTSYVFKNGEINLPNLEKMVNVVGANKLVLDLSCRKKNGRYYVVTDRWQKFSSFEITEDNLRNLEKYCDEFLIHAVDVEGFRKGIEVDLVKKLGRWVTLPTTYAGGVSSYDDIELILTLGRGKLGFTVGSALDIFGGTLSYKTIVKSYARHYYEKKA